MMRKSETREVKTTSASIKEGSPYETQWASFPVPTTEISVEIAESQKKYIRLHTKNGRLRLTVRLEVVIPGYGVFSGMCFMTPEKANKEPDRVIEL